MEAPPSSPGVRSSGRIQPLSSSTYKIQLTGQAAPAAEETNSADSPQIQQILPRVNDKTIPILAVALAILALGFVLLYRAPGNNPVKESDERGRS